MKKKKIKKKSKAKLLHQYYGYTGFYKFIGEAMKKAIPTMLISAALIAAVHFWVIDLGELFQTITDTFPIYGILSIFFISETILGLVPPEIFIAWANKTEDPLLYLVILTCLSYLGGMCSYFIGVSLRKLPLIHQYLEGKMAKHLKNAKKWGGFLIMVGALLPLPFAISCLAAGMIKFPFKYCLLFGLLRFVRFAIYGAAVFSVM